MLTSLDNLLFEAANTVVGRWWFFDTAMSYPLRNALVKAAVIGACFMAAWYGDTEPAAILARRRALIAGLVAAVLALAVSKSISSSFVIPRPFVKTTNLYALRGDQLVKCDPQAFRVPREYLSQQRSIALRHGEIDPNDRVSFPSDHATLYIAISLGILWASRPLGALALGWTVCVVLGSKLLHGLHSPVDIAAGAALAIIGFVVCERLTRSHLQAYVDWISMQFDRHRALGSAVLFVVVCEIVATLANVEQLLSAVTRHL